MATPHTVSPLLGVDFNTIVTAADIASGLEDGPQIGTQVFSTNGKIYVYAQANGAITASTAVCTVNASTFLATHSAGAYTSPATTMASGDKGWFSKASV